MRHNLCQLDKLSCFGCCGHSFTTIKQLKVDIKKNTKEFDESSSLESFRDRAHNWDLNPSGVCRNVVEKNGRVYCPLHPEINKKDLREGHCMPEFLCQTFKMFMNWSEEKQDKFVEFINTKNLDNYEYSIMMDSGKLLEEFEDSFGR